MRLERSASEWLKCKAPGFHEALRKARITWRTFRWESEIGLRHVWGKPLRDRSHIPILLNMLGLKGVGVEIGVLNGYYSEILLMYSKLTRLYSVDPWREFGHEEYDDLHNSRQLEHERRFEETKQRLARYGERSLIVRKTSEQAAANIGEPLDFVYIDANHSYEAVKQDLELWWPKLRPGGLFAGHDYLDGQLPEGNFGVKSAVDEFMAKHSQKLFVIPVLWPTWYCIKQ